MEGLPQDSQNCAREERSPDKWLQVLQKYLAGVGSSCVLEGLCRR